MRHQVSLICLAFTAALVSSARAGDWPRWRGVNFDNISTEKDWLGQWGSDGPKRLWKASVGIGFSSVTVADGRVFTSGHDGRKRGGSDTVFCFDAATGKELWKHTYPQELIDRYYEGGPGSTPTIEAGRVYTLGKEGAAFCFDAKTGAVIWQQELHKKLGCEIPEWGFSGSPHLEGDLVIYNAGDAGVALDRKTGAKVWQNGRGRAGYATPAPFTLAGKRALALFTAKHVTALEPQTGRTLWQHPWKTSYDINAADPLVQGDLMFLASAYGTGSGVIRFTAQKAEPVWRNKEVHSHMSGGVLIDGHVYAIDGEGDDASKLKCLDLATGKARWATPMSKTGTLMAADGRLIVLTGDGTLVVAAARPEAYQELARAQVLGGKCWTPPVLADGRVYVRNARGDLACVDVKGGR